MYAPTAIKPMETATKVDDTLWFLSQLSVFVPASLKLTPPETFNNASSLSSPFSETTVFKSSLSVPVKFSSAYCTSFGKFSSSCCMSFDKFCSAIDIKSFPILFWRYSTKLSTTLKIIYLYLSVINTFG